MSIEKPLVDKEYLLQKFPGKGGWTYAAIPEIPQDRKAYFGWVRVNGSIDGFELKHYNLMPMGNGMLFLPVRAEIRKKIRKQAGDYVKVILYPDRLPLEVPEEIIDCFRQESAEVFRRFQQFSLSEQKAYLDWIYTAKKDDTRADRILQMLCRVRNGLTLHDPRQT